MKIIIASFVNLSRFVASKVSAEFKDGAMRSAFPHLTQFRINFLSGMVAMGISVVVQLIMAPITLAYLGSEVYGLWTVLATLMIFGNFGDQGIGDALIRHVAMAHAKGETREVGVYAGTALALSMGIAVVVAVPVFILRRAIMSFAGVPAKFMAEGERLLAAIMVLLFLYLIGVTTNATLTGIGRIDLRNGIAAVGRILQAGVVVAGLVAGLGVWSLWWGQLVLLVFTVVLGWWLIIRLSGVRSRDLAQFSLFKASEMVHMGSFMLLARLLQLGLLPLMRVVISNRLDLDYVTYFDVGHRVTEMMRQVLIAGIKAVVPRVSASETKGLEGLMSVKHLNRRISWLVLLVAAPSFSLLYVFGGDLMRLWLGNSYHPLMQETLRWLLVPFLANMLIVSMYFSAIGWGRTDMCALVAAIAIVVFLAGIGANAWVDYRLGYRGLLWAYCVSMLFGAGTFFLLYVRLVRKREQWLHLEAKSAIARTSSREMCS